MRLLAIEHLHLPDKPAGAGLLRYFATLGKCLRALGEGAKTWLKGLKRCQFIYRMEK